VADNDVEALAEALYETQVGIFGTWDEIGDDNRQHYRRDAEGTLAALPDGWRLTNQPPVEHEGEPLRALLDRIDRATTILGDAYFEKGQAARMSAAINDIDAARKAIEDAIRADEAGKWREALARWLPRTEDEAFRVWHDAFGGRDITLTQFYADRSLLSQQGNDRGEIDGSN
jgi:hypothetical protein